ncbi:hypothetical protein ACT6QG_12325 [Xanthobacter sp. TB0136]|uniref:hypothetical protein n=1 Tax=Xanthobacter sp. TB0136 TaxID=3459177 RepID=UPI004039C330
MASEDTNATGFSSRKGRQPPTLDLKAEEVRVDESTSSPAPADATSGSTSKAGRLTGQPAPADRPEQATPPETPVADETQAPEAAAPATHADAGNQPETPPPPPPVTPGKTGLGLGGLAAALIVGALAGGAAGGGVVYYAAHSGALFPPPVDTTPLNERLAALESRPVATAQSVTDLGQKLDAADSRIADLARSVTDLARQPDSTGAPQEASTSPETGQALAGLQETSEQTLAALSQTREDITRLGQEQSALKAQLETTSTQVEDALRQATEATTTAGAIAGQVADAIRTAGEAREQVSGFAQRFDSLTQATDAAAAAARQAEALAPRVGLLDTSLAEVRREAGALAPRIAALDNRSTSLDTRMGALDAFSRASASMVVLADLKNAVEEGRPFSIELSAARTLLGPQAQVLEPLAAMAAKGYAPRNVLADRLEKEGSAAIADLAPPPVAPAGDTLVARLLSSAESLVSIRPADSPDPTGARGVLTRAVAQVRGGNLVHALGEVRQLPPQVADRLLPITAEIEARRQAVQLAETLYQQSLAAISGKTP